MVAALLNAAALAGPLDPGATLCLHPLKVPLDETGGEARRSDLERRLRDALIAATFTVPDPKAVADIVEHIRTDAGGFIDPATGQRDAARYRAVNEKVAAKLRGDFGCDAQLFASVTNVRARFADGTASWDGATDAVSSTGRVVLNALGGVSESGWVAALSLWLEASDLEGNDLAFRSAGIETLVSMAVLRDQDILPQDLWLTDAKKLDAAIQSALGPNGEALRQQGAPSQPAPTPPGPSVEEVRRLLGRPRTPDGH
jgi:hypothetical protein